jgi:HAD superfamily hydrolase (TIGR01549 family)
MKPQGLLFDFGGTLDTDGRHWSIMFQRGFCKYGITLAADEFARAYSEAERDCASGRIHHGDGMFATLLHQTRAQANRLAEGASPDRSDRLHESAVHVARWCLREVGETIRAVRPMLVELHDTYRMGLVSNFYGNLAAVCDELGILQLFDCIVDSDCVGCRKPGNEIFRIALEAMDRAPHDVVMIGDSYSRDIVPAKRIGCRTVWLKGETWETIAAPDDAEYCIRSVLDLPDLLRNMK